MELELMSSNVLHLAPFLVSEVIFTNSCSFKQANLCIFHLFYFLSQHSFLTHSFKYCKGKEALVYALLNLVACKDGELSEVKWDEMKWSFIESLWIKASVKGLNCNLKCKACLMYDFFDRFYAWSATPVEREFDWTPASTELLSALSDYVLHPYTRTAVLRVHLSAPVYRLFSRLIFHLLFTGNRTVASPEGEWRCGGLFPR